MLTILSRMAVSFFALYWITQSYLMWHEVFEPDPDDPLLFRILGLTWVLAGWWCIVAAWISV